MKDSAENPRFVETIGRRGYRFMVPVEPVSLLVGTGPPQPATESATPLRKPGQSKTLVVWIGAGLAVFLLLAFFILRHRRQPDVTGSGAPRISSIAVLPLENLSNDPEQEYFVEGMTDEIITDLATALSGGFNLSRSRRPCRRPRLLPNGPCSLIPISPKPTPRSD